MSARFLGVPGPHRPLLAPNSQLLGGCHEDAAPSRLFARGTWNPAPQVPLIGLVLGAETVTQRRLLVPDDEQMAADRGRAGVEEQRRREEQPRFANLHQERGDVDGIANPSVWADGDESPRGIPRPGGVPRPTCTSSQRHTAYRATPGMISVSAGQTTGSGVRSTLRRIHQGAYAAPAPGMTIVKRMFRSARLIGQLRAPTGTRLRAPRKP